MSARSLAKATNAPQADSAVKTSLLKHSGVKPVEAEPKQQPEDWAKKNFEQKSGFKADFSRIPVGGSSHPVVQPKLVVGRPDDRYEQEADRVAEQVMRMPGSDHSLTVLGQPPTIQPLKPGSSTGLQRQTAAEEGDEEKDEEEPIQTKALSTPPTIHRIPPSVAASLQRQLSATSEKEQKEEEEDVASLQRKADTTNSPQVSPSLENRLNGRQGRGQPLPEPTRTFMESRFNHDFSGVRVHTDPQAARDLNARAFTRGRDIYFGSGQYQPHAPTGQQLLAHELTHVVQQGGAIPTSSSVQTAPFYPLPSSLNSILQRKAAPAPAPASDTNPTTSEAVPLPGVLDLATLVGAELQLPTTHDTWLADQPKESGTLKVKLDDLAQGDLAVRKTSNSYEIEPQKIALSHPLFQVAGDTSMSVGLVLYTQGKALVGHIGLDPKLKANDLAKSLQGNPDLLGLAGFDMPKLPTLINKFEAGNLHFGLQEASITLGGAFSGTVSIVTKNAEISTFEGKVDVKAKGLKNATLELKRSEAGTLAGKVDVAVDLPKNISGSVLVLWDGQSITGEGKVGYQGEKLSGEILVKFMDKQQADQLESEKKAPPEGEAAAAPAKAKQKGKGKTPKIDYVIFGEGDLTFAFTDWLNGSAHVILDPKGFVTIIGKITPQAEVLLFDQRDYVKELFKIEPRASYGIPVVGNIFIFGNISLSAFAKLGPGKLYKISAEGTYSTDPKKSNDFKIQASLNISAAAGIKLRGEAGAGLEILSHDIKAGAGIDAIAGIRGYAEATPVIGYQEKQGTEGEDKKGEFFISGDVEIAAQLFLALQGDLFVEIDAPWWSPVPDKKWTWPLGQKEWPLGKSYGVVASVDYVIGSKQWPSVELKPVEFSADKFLTDLYADKSQPKSDKGEQQGKWKEKNSKEAEPPKGEQKGAAQPGKLAEQSAPSSTAAAASKPKKKGEPATPNARTAEGKTVKDYQEKAAKEGKKPGAKEPTKGTAKEQPTGKTEAISLGLSMENAQHTLTITSGKTANVEMASQKEKLSSKAQKAIEKLQPKKDTEKQIKALKSIKSQAEKVEKLLQKDSLTKAQKSKMTEHGTKLVSLIQNYATTYKEKDIQGILKEYPSPVVNLYGNLAGKDPEPPPDGTTREAHHAPADEFAKSLSNSLAQAARGISKQDPETYNLLKGASNKIDTATATPDNLSAILLHHQTHKVHGAGPRIHGSEIKDALQERLKKKGIDVDKAITTTSGELSVKPGEVAYNRYISKIATGKESSTKKKVKEALQDDAKNVVKTLYKNASEQALSQVYIAVKASKFDGSDKEKNTALSKLRKLAKTVWEKGLLSDFFNGL